MIASGFFVFEVLSLEVVEFSSRGRSNRSQYPSCGIRIYIFSQLVQLRRVVCVNEVKYIVSFSLSLALSL